MRSLKTYLSVAFIAGQIYVNAQDTLTIENALEKAITSNFDIKLFDNSLQQAANNKSIYNSGLLPTVTGAANGSYANNRNLLVSQQGQEVIINGAETFNYGGSVALNYVIYNGGKRKNNFEKLKTSYNLADNQKKQQINSTVQTVYSTYYNLARAVNQKEILNEALAISNERLERISYQFEQGQTTNLDRLNAEVDVNNDSLNIINSQVSIDNLTRNLNFLLGQNIDSEFTVSKSVIPNKKLLFSTIKENMLQNNYQLKQVEINSTLSKYDLKVSQSAWKPTISANASYGISNNNFGSVGLYSTQNVSGLSSVLNLSWNIFDGGSTKTKVKNAKINIDNQEIYKEQINLSLINELSTVWADYTNQLVIINSEKLNVEVNKQNFLITKEKFNLGQLSSLDFRQAQLNLVTSQLNLSNALFNVKLSEINLKSLEGTLIKQL